MRILLITIAYGVHLGPNVSCTVLLPYWQSTSLPSLEVFQVKFKKKQNRKFKKKRTHAQNKKKTLEGMKGRTLLQEIRMCGFYFFINSHIFLANDKIHKWTDNNNLGLNCRNVQYSLIYCLWQCTRKAHGDMRNYNS